mmetsp:Transcript_33851/g.74047  ORF Transcript_33851/g.74047 Transcript_33851/m.74047 type:complete len:223 (+) Transcript_33851:1647-2315(+)
MHNTAGMEPLDSLKELMHNRLFRDVVQLPPLLVGKVMQSEVAPLRHQAVVRVNGWFAAWILQQVCKAGVSGYHVIHLDHVLGLCLVEEVQLSLAFLVLQEELKCVLPPRVLVDSEYHCSTGASLGFTCFQEILVFVVLGPCDGSLQHAHLLGKHPVALLPLPVVLTSCVLLLQSLRVALVKRPVVLTSCVLLLRRLRVAVDGRRRLRRSIPPVQAHHADLRV